MKIFKNHDWFLTLTILALQLIGLVVIYSVTFTAKTPVEGAGTINRQMIFFVLGFFIYFFVSTIDPTYYKYNAIRFLIFAVMVALLVYVKVFGDPIRNTNRWIEWGFVRIQPSEYTKIALIILNSSFLAGILNRKITGEIDWKGIWKDRSVKQKISSFFKNIRSFYPLFLAYGISGLISLICIVLVLIEPALGNASIIALICLSIYVIAFPRQKKLIGTLIVFLLGANIVGGLINLQFFYQTIGVSLIVEHIDIVILFVSLIIAFLIIKFARLKILIGISALILGIVAIFGGRYAWGNVIKPYQKQRVESFFNPETDPQGAGWHLTQAKIAIGSGRVFGKGFLQGTQSKLRYLPEAYSDFIFAAFCEEFGLVGALVLIGLYIYLITRIIKVAKNASNNYEALICFGVAIMILIHVFINMGMNMGILPITGIPLPLVSYGGSSIMVTMIALGLVQAVNKHKDLVDMQQSLSKSFFSE